MPVRFSGRGNSAPGDHDRPSEVEPLSAEPLSAEPDAPGAHTPAREDRLSTREVVGALVSGLAGGLAALHGDSAAMTRLLDTRPALTRPAPTLNREAVSIAEALRTGLLILRPMGARPAPAPTLAALDDAAVAVGLGAGQRAVLRALGAADERSVNALLAQLKDSLAEHRGAILERFLKENARLGDVVAVPALLEGLPPGHVAIVQTLAALGTDINALRFGRSVREVMLAPAWEAMSGPERAARFTALLADRDAYLSTVFDPDATGEKTLSALVPGPCSTDNAVHFRLEKDASVPNACTMSATFEEKAGTRLIPFIVPEGVDVGDKPQRVADALAYLPSALRDLIQRVVFNPAPNPDDDELQQDPQFTPNHTSAMTAGSADGTVTVYPTMSAYGIELVGLLAHESAHLLEPLVGLDPELTGLWQLALDADEMRPSAYAFSTSSEHFAETLRLYSSARLSPAFGQFRTLMPVHFAAMDTIFERLGHKP